MPLSERILLELRRQKGTPKSRYFIANNSTSVNMLANRHSWLAANDNKHCWRAFQGYQHRRP